MDAQSWQLLTFQLWLDMLAPMSSTMLSMDARACFQLLSLSWQLLVQGRPILTSSRTASTTARSCLQSIFQKSSQLVETMLLTALSMVARSSQLLSSHLWQAWQLLHHILTGLSTITHKSKTSISHSCHLSRTNTCSTQTTQLCLESILLKSMKAFSQPMLIIQQFGEEEQEKLLSHLSWIQMGLFGRELMGSNTNL